MFHRSRCSHSEILSNFGLVTLAESKFEQHLLSIGLENLNCLILFPIYLRCLLGLSVLKEE